MIPLWAFAAIPVYVVARVVYWYQFSRGRDLLADGYYTLLCMRRYRENGRKRFLDIPGMVIPHAHAYPSLGIHLLSFFSDRFVYRWSGLLNSVIDLVFLLGLYGVGLLLGLPAAGLLVAALAFALLPALYNRNPVNAMHFSLTWRDLGRFSASAYFLALTLAMLHPAAHVWKALALASLLLCFYSSQFAMQCVIFGSVPLSLLSWSPLPLATMVAGHVLLVVADGAHLRHYYGYKVDHFRQYFQVLRHTHDQTNGDYAFSPSHVVALLAACARLRFREAETIASRDPLLRGLYLFPIQIPVGIALARLHTPAAKLLLAWYLSSVALWLLTLTPWLKIFGEPDRYLEFFGYLPVLLGLGLGWEWLSSEAPAWLAVTAALLAFQAHFYVRELVEKQHNREPGLDRAYDKVSRMRASGEFLRGKRVYPVSISFVWKVSYCFACDSVYPPADDPAETEFLCRYPMPRLDTLRAVCAKYAIDYLVVERGFREFLEVGEVKALTEPPISVGDFFALRVVR